MTSINQIRFLLVTIVIFLQHEAISGQRQWVLPTTTAAEMRNPYTYYWPYAIAASEAYRDWFVNAQQITNQLYKQAYATQAFSWASGQAGQAGGMVGGQGFPGGQGGMGGQGMQGGQGMMPGGQGGMGGQGMQGGQGGMGGPGMQGGQGGMGGPGDQGGMGGFNG